MTRNGKAEAYQQAYLDQLNAEIGASAHTVKSLALAMGMDYNTFRRYVVGERAIPLVVLWSATEQLAISPMVFMQRAHDRYGSSPAG